MKKLIFAILTILFLSNTADAGVFFRRGGGFFRQSTSCRTSCVATPAVCKPVIPYVEQVIVQTPPLIYPVLVPAYQFQYVAPCVVPQGQPVMGMNPMVANGGNMAGNMALPNQNDKIKELARALLEEMSRQSQPEGANDDGPPMALGPITQGYHAPLPTNQGHPGLAALAKNCSACHTGTASKGDMMIFSQPGVLNPNVSWAQIREVVKTSKMPPRDSQFRLNVDEAAAIIALANNLGRN
jgi:hypothetical protein